VTGLLSSSPTRAAAAAHLSSVAAVITVTAAAGRVVIWAGMLAFLGPLLMRVAAGRGDEFVRRHATAALRFNVSVAVYLVAIVALMRLLTGSPYTVQVVPFLLFLNLMIALNWLMFTAIGAQRAATGQQFTYPMTLGRR
jgi:uncharacterized Tic20 family protein